jgi:hypothetical protein
MRAKRDMSLTRQLLLGCALGPALGASVLFACSSDEPPPEQKTDAGPRFPNNCVKPGTKNNEQGIGGYCESNADCVSGKSLCTGVFGAPPNASFCTRLCSGDPNCGEGLYCANDPRGVACVPIVCGVLDAGSDAPSDVTFDAALDVVEHDATDAADAADTD